MKVFNWRDIDVKQDFVYDTPKASTFHDGFAVRVHVKDAEGRVHPFIHQGARMNIPFGVQRKSQEGRPDHYPCVFSFPDLYRDEDDSYTSSNTIGNESLDYFKFMRSLDANNTKTAYERSNEWFNRKKKDGAVFDKQTKISMGKSRDVIEELYHKNVTFPDDAKYAPKLSTKIMYSNGKFNTLFFDQDGKKITFEDIQSSEGDIKRLSAIPLIETTGLWFAGKSFGMSMRVRQLMVFVEPVVDHCIINAYRETGESETTDMFFNKAHKKRKIDDSCAVAFNPPSDSNLQKYDDAVDRQFG